MYIGFIGILLTGLNINLSVLVTFDQVELQCIRDRRLIKVLELAQQFKRLSS